MASANTSDPTMKLAIKEAMLETLQEHRELLYDVVTEVLEDMAMASAIAEGEKTEFTTREEIFDILRGKSYVP